MLEKIIVSEDARTGIVEVYEEDSREKIGIIELKNDGIVTKYTCNKNDLRAKDKVDKVTREYMNRKIERVKKEIKEEPKGTVIIQKDYSRTGMTQIITSTLLESNAEDMGILKNIIERVLHTKAKAVTGWWCNQLEARVTGYGLDNGELLAQELEAKGYKVKRLW